MPKTRNLKKINYPLDQSAYEKKCLEKCKLKPQENCTNYLVEWLQLKELTTNYGQGCGRKEFFGHYW